MIATITELFSSDRSDHMKTSLVSLATCQSYCTIFKKKKRKEKLVQCSFKEHNITLCLTTIKSDRCQEIFTLVANEPNFAGRGLSAATGQDASVHFSYHFFFQICSFTSAIYTFFCSWNF